MKLRGPIFFSVLVVTLIVAAFYPKADPQEKEAVLMRIILSVMNQAHFQPQVLDDKFSEKLYDLYLDRIDSGRNFLTQEEVNRLSVHKKNLDDQLLASNHDFFDLSLSLLDNGINRAQTFYKEILAQPFDFSTEEYVELSGDKRPFAANEKELKEYWRKYLKFEVLSRVADKLEGMKEAGEEGNNMPLAEIEKEARAKVLENMDLRFSNFKKIKRSSRFGDYLTAFTNIFDPQSIYFEPVEKQRFEIDFYGQLEGIGARLLTIGDYTKVSEIVVGGPAWKGKELQENDVILKVAQGDGEFKDVVGMNGDDVVQLIRGKKGTKVRLNVKKTDGTIKDIVIIRDLVVLEESFAKSLIIDGANEGEKIGYIFLPKFYANFDDANGRFCAKDVAAELEKLKAENVNGIILDLRNNTGGALYEAVEMSGFFIEKGPIVQVKSKDSEPEILEDQNPQVQYNGPLVVMVNSFSASASEILAGALQDYGRAIIVGSKSTYGKGTVQRFINLDRGVRGFEELKPLGEVKVTMQKFYRINGSSTQLKGVTPDIILPDNYSYINIIEEEEKNPLPWTQIKGLNYSQNVYKIHKLKEIKANSENRIAQSDLFKKIDQNARRVQQQRKETSYPLQMERYLAMEEARKEQNKEYRELFKNTVIKGVRSVGAGTQPLANADVAVEAAEYKDLIDAVSKDIYLKEALYIMHDVISIK